MKGTWLHREGGPRVLIFFAGWGMDEAPFRRLTSARWDVVVYYDFRRTDEVPFLAELEAYPEKTLAAWSLGCAAAHRVTQERRWAVSRAVAINGTLTPEDDETGIPARWIAATMQHLTEGGWATFVRRMCADPAARASFEAAPPQRDLAEAVEELQALRRLPAPDACVFHTALVAESDRIIRPENQRACWTRYGVPVRALPGGHYPFHLWSSWEEVLA